MSENTPPPASVRDDLTILGLCSMYECSDPAMTERRMQPNKTGGLVFDIALCEDCARLVDWELVEGDPEEYQG